jgi:hypothetical protein
MFADVQLVERRDSADKMEVAEHIVANGVAYLEGRTSESISSGPWTSYDLVIKWGQLRLTVAANGYVQVNRVDAWDDFDYHGHPVSMPSLYWTLATGLSVVGPVDPRFTTLRERCRQIRQQLFDLWAKPECKGKPRLQLS